MKSYAVNNYLILSINSSGAHTPWATARHLLRCQPGGGTVAILIAARGLGISVPRGDPRAFDTRVFKKMDKFFGKDEAFVKAKASRRRKAISALTCVASLTQCLFFTREKTRSVRAAKSRKLFLFCAETTELRNQTTRNLSRNRPLKSNVLV